MKEMLLSTATQEWLLYEALPYNDAITAQIIRNAQMYVYTKAKSNDEKN